MSVVDESMLARLNLRIEHAIPRNKLAEYEAKALNKESQQSFTNRIRNE